MVIVVTRDDAILLRQRSASESLMPGMWELPHSDGRLRGKASLQLKHSITTTDWNITVFRQSRLRVTADMEWVPMARISRFPLTGLTRKILLNLKMLA